MCGVFGWIRGKECKATAQELYSLTKALAKESEIRGTDASGVATFESGRLFVRKKDVSGSQLVFPKVFGKGLVGHTRATTQGSEKNNYNNHPFFNPTQTFVLAHNGVIYNDKKLRDEEKLPATHIETDSYIIPQLIDKYGMDNLKTVCEKLDGSFAVPIVTKDDKFFFLMGGNPVEMLYVKELDLFIYASTTKILFSAAGDIVRVALGMAQGITVTPVDSLTELTAHDFAVMSFDEGNIYSYIDNRWSVVDTFAYDNIRATRYGSWSSYSKTSYTSYGSYEDYTDYKTSPNQFVVRDKDGAYVYIDATDTDGCTLQSRPFVDKNGEVMFHTIYNFSSIRPTRIGMEYMFDKLTFSDLYMVLFWAEQNSLDMESAAREMKLDRAQTLQLLSYFSHTYQQTAYVYNNEALSDVYGEVVTGVYQGEEYILEIPKGSVDALLTYKGKVIPVGKPYKNNRDFMSVLSGNDVYLGIHLSERPIFLFDTGADNKALVGICDIDGNLLQWACNTYKGNKFVLRSKVASAMFNLSEHSPVFKHNYGLSKEAREKALLELITLPAEKQGKSFTAEPYDADTDFKRRYNYAGSNKGW